MSTYLNSTGVEFANCEDEALSLLRFSEAGSWAEVRLWCGLDRETTLVRWTVVTEAMSGMGDVKTHKVIR